VGEEAFDFCGADLARMPFSVVQDEPLNPADVSLLGSVAEVARAHSVAHDRQ
jgi:hypothetical protein